MKKTNKRPPIPSDILRQVRQKCKFGCIICGCPIYDYDHLFEEWSKTGEHKEENLFLLCPNHHREKTNGVISKETIERIFKGLDRNTTTPKKLYLSDFRLILGDNVIQAFSGYIFNILDKDYFKIKNQQKQILMDCEIFNKNNQRAFSIQNNAYVCYSDIWDINFSGKTISFRNKKYDKFLEITIDGGE